ncbi:MULTISPECIES: SapC family protein [unclassified Xanthobacter]|uniref:SapC family protein n=1 Tax=unclassified Xanthobacter TaxID=2623496 RepID=UPI001F1C3A30|nr:MULTISPECIES: SapC family protein [unclassified Xanthobacter]
MAATPSSATPTSSPLFYQSPVLLNFKEHGQFGLRPEVTFGFAAEATAIPLVATEFAQAQRHYPIVFASNEGAMPLAVTGLTMGRNLFVDPQGNWTAGTYVPGYVRRYPFISMAPEAGGATMLGLDATSSRVSADAARDGADRLFTADGKPTQVGSAAMAFCDAYAVEYERTRAFAAALVAHGLLAERSARIKHPNGAEQVVQGFRLIDEPTFRALPADVVAEFHAKGWLDLIVLHLASQGSWLTLMERATAGDGAPASTLN